MTSDSAILWWCCTPARRLDYLSQAAEKVESGPTPGAGSNVRFAPKLPVVMVLRLLAPFSVASSTEHTQAQP
jgi:hypothetical protein